MYIPKSFHTTLVLETLIDFFSYGKGISISINDLPEEFSKPAACFVSLYTKNGEMRGCMGSIVPQEENLFNEITSNTMHAAFNDNRFTPLKENELEDVSMTVEIIEPMQKVTSLEELQPDIYGVMIKDKNGKMGVMLPYPEEIKTVEQQIKIACKKGGINCSDIKGLDIYKFKVVCFS